MSTARSATAMVLTRPRTLEARSFALPDIGPDDGLLRVEACGLCGTDHELYTGHIPAPRPVVPGSRPSMRHHAYFPVANRDRGKTRQYVVRIHSEFRKTEHRHARQEPYRPQIEQ